MAPSIVGRSASRPRIKGDIEDIERSNGRTCVIVDEGVNMAAGTVFRGDIVGGLEP
jgi:hypothetical protein